jgi:hypothetical protein
MNTCKNCVETTNMPTPQPETDEQRRLRLEFTQHWPRIWETIKKSDSRALMPHCHHAAWLAFCAGKGVKCG